jgi:hypothetical protein
VNFIGNDDFAIGPIDLAYNFRPPYLQPDNMFGANALVLFLTYKVMLHFIALEILAQNSTGNIYLPKD